MSAPLLKVTRRAEMVGSYRAFAWDWFAAPEPIAVPTATAAAPVRKDRRVTDLLHSLSMHIVGLSSQFPVLWPSYSRTFMLTAVCFRPHGNRGDTGAS